jgi:peptidoglycan hydrolase CwlO-like protein
MIKLLKEPIFIWIIAGLFLFVACFFAYKHFTTPNITEIQEQAKLMKIEYDKAIQAREVERQELEKRISELQKKFNAKVSEYQKTKKEIEKIEKPKEHQERIDRLNSLGIPPLSQ